jgi:drug/metabolite transporter (DMT)-like permease
MPLKTSEISASQLAGQNLRGIFAILASAAAFMCNDAITKLNLAELPLGEIMFLRNTVASLLCLGLALWMGALRPLRTIAVPAVALRTFGEVSTTILYLSALALMPLANLTFLMQSTPLAITAASAVLLGERVGWRRWLATLVGLGGVLLIVRPGTSGYNHGTLLALGAIATVVLRDLSTRRIPAGVPSLLVTLVSSVTIMLAGLGLGLFETWVAPSEGAWIKLVASAVFLSLALYFSVTAMRLGELSVITPFRFASVLFALLMGYAVWREIPDQWALAGTAIVVSAGLYTLHREQVRRRTLSSTHGS